MDAGHLDEALRAAGIPIVGVILQKTQIAGDPAVASIQYAPEATAQQRATGDAMAASFDWAAEPPKTKSIEERVADLEEKTKQK